MNDKEPLGVVRVCITGAFFDLPYFDEQQFARVVTAVRADRYFMAEAVFVPLHAITCILKMPKGTAEGMTQLKEMQSAGATRQ